MHNYVYECMHVSMYVCMYVYACVYVFMHCIYVCLHLIAKSNIEQVSYSHMHRLNIEVSTVVYAHCKSEVMLSRRKCSVMVS